jgi:hypothetical protein
MVRIGSYTRPLHTYKRVIILGCNVKRGVAKKPQNAVLKQSISTERIPELWRPHISYAPTLDIRARYEV